MSIDGAVQVQLTGNDRRAVGINPAVNISCNFNPSVGIANGAGANQANILYQGTFALVAGAANIVLNSLTDSYGTSLSTLARIKGWAFQNNSTANPMTLGAGTNPWVSCFTGTLIIPPGAIFAFGTPDATGWIVTTGTANAIKVAGTGTDAFTLLFFGAQP